MYTCIHSSTTYNNKIAFYRKCTIDPIMLTKLITFIVSRLCWSIRFCKVFLTIVIYFSSFKNELLNLVWQTNSRCHQKLAITYIENVFALFGSWDIVVYETDWWQAVILGQLLGNKMASKMAADSPFHSILLCITFVLF